MRKFLLCLCILICIFIVPTKAFEGAHERDGEFLIYEADRDNPKLIHATHLSVIWERTLNKHYTTNTGSKFIITRANDDKYIELEIITTEPTTFTLYKDCNAHSYPVEAKGYLTGEVIPAGTYKVNKFSAGWYGILKEDGTNVWVHPNRDSAYKYIKGKNAAFSDTNEILTVKNVNNIPIYTNYLLTSTNNSVRPGYTMKPLSVTIHNTGSPGKGANALAHAKIQYERQNNNNIWTSWHFQVDNTSIYQSIPMNEVAWHSGDGQRMGNSSSISIEICENSDGNYAQAEKNAAYLAAQILYENDLPSDAINRHYDWSSKNCPQNIIEGTKGTMGWEKFKALVKQYYNQLVEENKVEELVEIEQEYQDLISQTPYKNEGNILYNIPFQTMIHDLIQQFEKDNIQVEITNEDEIKITEGVVTTGYKMNLTTIETLPNENTDNSSSEMPVVLTNENEEPKNIEEEQIEPLTEEPKVLSKCTLLLSVKGDVNGDGKISSLDYVLVKNHILKIKKLMYTSRTSANVNMDDKISSLDYVLIKNHILGIQEIK